MVHRRPVVVAIVRAMERAPLSVQASAVALVRDPRGVLMVESLYPGTSDSFWALPGGMVEPGERIDETLVREVAEETGLSLGGSVTVVAVIWLRTAEGAPDWITFLCAPGDWRGELRPDDPDGVTLRAAFVPPAQAIERLSTLPWGLSEPIVHSLEGGPPGGVWTYRWNGEGPWDGNGPATLIHGPARDGT